MEEVICCSVNQLVISDTVQLAASYQWWLLWVDVGANSD